MDRSIHGPGDFIETNIVGTYNLLKSLRGCWSALPEGDKFAFRFLQVYTDEVVDFERFNTRRLSRRTIRINSSMKSRMIRLW